MIVDHCLFSGEFSICILIYLSCDQLVQLIINYKHTTVSELNTSTQLLFTHPKSDRRNSSSFGSIFQLISETDKIEHFLRCISDVNLVFPHVQLFGSVSSLTNLKFPHQEGHEGSVDAALDDEDRVGEFDLLCGLQVFVPIVQLNCTWWRQRNGLDQNGQMVLTWTEFRFSTYFVRH